jgi:hypothetical protein
LRRKYLRFLKKLKVNPQPKTKKEVVVKRQSLSLVRQNSI